MQTPSTPPRPRLEIRRLAWACAFALAGFQAQAHDLSQDPLPAAAGWRLGAAAAVTGIAASGDSAWPATGWRGLPGSGRAPDGRRGLGLEHATVDLAGAIVPSAGTRLGAVFAAGRHGSGQVHAEAARIEARTDLGLDRLALQLGRDRVPLGPVLTSAGHVDRHAQVPAIKRVTLDGDWIADGLNLRWQRGVTAGLQGLDLGLWRSRSWPGAASAGWTPALHLEGGWDRWRADLSYARLRPQGRGVPVTGATAVHSHDTPDCRLGTVNLVCFDGRSELLGASLSWDPHEQPWAVTLGGLLQREQGHLASSLGQAEVRSRTRGGWLDLQWRLGEPWLAGLRLEHAQASHRLSGPGASRVATEAGLLPNTPVRRAAASLTWSAAPDWRLGAEAGTESSSLPSTRWIGLRAIWSRRDVAGLSW
ncbi:hypothetical protein [Leptothrix discophora]|uniref:Uncharacterized protein n=1 Tax=Leptothrix discophora TaxID=89 RepID=A0ABT9FZB4_LEPDI|nr:hypothetical protein [Leptothrix discophora]MDP4299578.1 hypothetical protein [Leptothrix discophora]